MAMIVLEPKRTVIGVTEMTVTQAKKAMKSIQLCQ